MVSHLTNLAEYSVTLPILSEPLVSRTNWVTWIHDRFSPQRQIIIVQAPDGAGKTTLLSQFVNYYSDRSFSFFIRPDQYFTTPRLFFRELCVQMTVALGGAKDDLPRDYDELKQYFGDLYYQVGKTARKLPHPLFFVIDGLEWTENSLHDENIARVIPTQLFPNTYLLASSRPDQKFDFEFDGEKCPLFSEPEVSDYFNRCGIGLSNSDIQRIYKLSDGYPGYLDHLRREIQQNGQSTTGTQGDLPSGFRQLLERTWSTTQINDEQPLRIMALLGYAKTPLTLLDLTSILDCELEVLSKVVENSPWLKIVSDHVSFITDAHRQFFAEKLSQHRSWSEQKLIELYAQNRYDSRSLEQLPVLLMESRQYEALRSLVDVDYLTRVVQEQKSLYLSRRNARMLADLAYEQQDWDAVSKYTLFAAILSTVSNTPVLEAEIDALLEIDDYIQSFQLAHQAILVEDRLKFIARIGNRMRQQGETLPDAIIETIDSLVQQLDVMESNKEALFEVVADLFYVNKDLALSLARKIVKLDLKDRFADVLLAKLAWRLEGDIATHADEISGQIKNKRLAAFARANSQVVAKMSPDEVIDDVHRIQDTSFKLLQLRAWCNANRSNPKSAKVIAFALEEITAAKSSPSMRQLRQFAEPLLSADVGNVLQIVERFDLLKETSVKHPFDELVRLELILARVEKRIGREDAAITRLYNTYFSMDMIEELDIRCYCLVRILLSLSYLTPLDNKLKKEIEVRLSDEYQSLLQVSADHLSLTRHLLSPLTNYDHVLARTFAAKLNTEDRRDEAFRRIVTVYVDREPKQLDFDFIYSFFELPSGSTIDNRIVNTEDRDRALVSIIDELSEQEARALIKPSVIPSLKKLLDLIDTISSNIGKSIAYAYAYKMHKGIDNRLAQKYRELMLISWEQIEHQWQRVKIGFDLANILASRDRQIAQELISSARKLRTESVLTEGKLAEIVINTIKLGIRIVPDLVKLSAQEYRSYNQRLLER